MRKGYLFLIPIAGFVLIAAMLGYLLVSYMGGERDPRALPSALLNRPAPEFAKLESPLQGVPGFASTDLKGQVTVVNVWASWCPPCLAEHPQIVALSRVPGIRVFGLNYKDRNEKAAAWLGENGNAYHAIGSDRNGNVGIDWGVYGVPETFVLDRNAVIRYRHAGPVTAELLKGTILPLIEKLKADK